MRLLATLLLLLAPTGALAQSGRLHVTELGRRVLARTDQIVEARVAKLMPAFRGVTTARLEVSRRVHGYDRSRQIVLLFIEDYVAPDAFQATLDRSTVSYARKRRAGRESAAEGATERKTSTAREASAGTRQGALGVRLAEGEEGLFFLRRKEASYSMVGFVPTRDPLYDSKRKRLRDVLRIESIPALERRTREARRFYLADLENPNPWARGNSARELMSLARRYRGLLTPEDGRRLAVLLDKEPEPPIQASLERAVRAIDPDLAFAYAREAETRSREANAKALAAERGLLERTRDPDLRAADLTRVARRYGRGATSLLSEFLADEAPIVRERAAQALADVGGPSARAPLREALAKERDVNAATAIVYACGIGGDPEAVPVLRRRLGEPDLERPVLHALARIGTRDARAALEAHRKTAAPATAELIDTLLREEFSG